MYSTKENYGLFTKLDGPVAVVRACNFCKHFVKLPVGRGGGRGYGMREGNIQRGAMIQHAKEAHPAEYAAFIQTKREHRKARAAL